MAIERLSSISGLYLKNWQICDTLYILVSTETKAQEFADNWCRQLWAKHFDHPDPVHNRPDKEELALLENDNTS